MTKPVESRTLLSTLAGLVLDGESPRATRARGVTALGLALAGVFFWLDDFNQGTFLLSHHDWPKEHDALAALMDAVRSWSFPWHTTIAHQGTARLFANPETPASPFVLLLGWLDVASFIVARVLAWHVAGVAGIWICAERWRLPTAAMAAFGLLAQWNGHITAHLTAGHSMWSAYLLLPWAAYALVRFAEDARDERAAIGFAFVIGLVMLDGGFHLAGAVLLGLAALPLGTGTGWRPILPAFVLSAALGAIRIVPALATLGTAPRENGFGYPDAWRLLESLVAIRPMTERLAENSAIGWWELDAYVGLEGLAFVAVGLALAPITRRIAGAIVVPIVLSIGSLYFVVHALHVPVLSAERIVSRFVGPVLVLAPLVAAQGWKRLFVDRKWTESPLAALAALVGVWAIASALLAHAEVWNFAATGQVPSLAVVARVPASLDRTLPVEASYVASVVVGAAITIAALSWAIRRLLRRDA